MSLGVCQLNSGEIKGTLPFILFCTYRIALGPRAGQKVLTGKDPAVRLASQETPQPQGCVSAQGFSLHADTFGASHQRQKLEQLCRYIMRPALGHKREARGSRPGGQFSHSLYSRHGQTVTTGICGCAVSCHLTRRQARSHLLRR